MSNDQFSASPLEPDPDGLDDTDPMGSNRVPTAGPAGTTPMGSNTVPTAGPAGTTPMGSNSTDDD